MLKNVKHLLEAAVVKSLFSFFYILPINVASAISGLIGKSVGPHLKVTKVARRNIKKALPELSDAEVENIIKEMWENLGRVIGEFPHMTKFKGDDFAKIVTIKNRDIIEKITKDDHPAMFFSGHFANWELIAKSVFEAGCQNLGVVYRKSNNPYLDKLITKVRNNYQKYSMAKGPVGARHIIKHIKQGTNIGMLVDQKQNDGIAVPFFGRDAMTPSAIAALALKYKCPVVPIQIRRTKGANFHITAHEPIILDNTGDAEKDVFQAMKKINSILEDWIKQNPEQWFWVHNRWPKD